MEMSTMLLPRYIRTLGLFDGLIIFLKVEVFHARRLSLRGYKGKLFIRPGTTDRKVFREIFLFKTYEVELREPPETIIDAGANIGLSSVYFTRRYPSAIIYAIEPETSNFEMLIKNCSPYANIIPVKAALWGTDTQLQIRDLAENHWAFTVEEAKKNQDSLKGFSVSGFMKEFGIPNIGLLKIDIEGAEVEIFRAGYEQWLRYTNCIIIELHDWLKAGSSATFFRAMSNFPIATRIHQGMLLIEFNR
jgi:FkbM family methyltransferase